MKTIRRYLGMGFWVLLAGLRLSAAWQARALLPFLLAAQSGLAAYQLWVRKEAKRQAPWWVQAIAWGSALLPLAMKVEHVNGLAYVVSILGLLLALWSMVTLGRSFGIAPADRGLVTTGPYGLVRHPLYAGELLSVLGALGASLTLRNGVIVALLLFSLMGRIQAEEQILSGYQDYQARTRWRLLWGVW